MTNKIITNYFCIRIFDLYMVSGAKKNYYNDREKAPPLAKDNKLIYK